MYPLCKAASAVSIHIPVAGIPDEGIVHIRPGLFRRHTEVIGNAEAGMLVSGPVAGAPVLGKVGCFFSLRAGQKNVRSVIEIGLAFQILPLTLGNVCVHIAA